MTKLSSAWVVSLAVAWCAACFVAGVVILLRSLSAPVPDTVFGVRGQSGIFLLATTAIGALLALRRPENRVSWLVLAIGVLGGLYFVGGEYAISSLGTSAPGAAVAAWIYDVSWIPPQMLIFVTFIFFPDGTLLSKRWRFAVAVDALAGLATFSFFALRPGHLQFLPYDNPFGLPVARDAFGALEPFATSLFGVAALLAGAALVLRYRRSGREVRQQLKWLVVAVVVFAITQPIGFVFRDVKAAQLVASLGILAVLVSIPVAIFKYGLYEIDVIIERSAVYGALTAILAGLFVAFQEVLKRVFVATTGENSDLAVLLSLFIIATAFVPVRSRLQAVVDRVFKSPTAVAAPTAGTSAAEDALRALARLHADGILSDAEYEAKKRELLARL